MQKFSPTALVLLFCTTILLLTHWLLGKQLNTLPPLKLTAEFKQHKSCDLNNSALDEFKIFLHDTPTVDKVLSVFCNDDIIAKQYSKVSVFWGGGDSSIIQMVGTGTVNLILTKPSIVQALSAHKTHGYQAIAGYQNYKAFLIGFKEQPELTKQYLWDKSIALVNYPTSRSGHILPKQLFSSLGLSLDRMNIVYTNSHEQSRALLINGEVDLISSYWSQEDKVNLSEKYKTSLPNEVDATQWFLKLDKNNTVLKCQTQQLLSALSASLSSSYYNDIKILNSGECSNG